MFYFHQVLVAGYLPSKSDNLSRLFNELGTQRRYNQRDRTRNVTLPAEHDGEREGHKCGEYWIENPSASVRASGKPQILVEFGYAFHGQETCRHTHVYSTKVSLEEPCCEALKRRK